MERGDGQDAQYPQAPLPAHERSWRHPSELGQSNWLRSEPPLVVGRGLSVATGTVGAVLVLGLLWLMVPRGGRDHDVAVEASATSVRGASSAASIRGELPSGASASARAAATAMGSAPGGGDGVTTMLSTELSTDRTDTELTAESRVLPSSDAASTASSTTTGREDIAPIPTMVLAGDGVLAGVGAPAVVVALVPGHLVVTTASAVLGRSAEDVAVQLPSGEVASAAVVAIDVDAGTAVLSLTDAVDASLIETSRTTVATGNVVVLTPDPASVTTWQDGSATRLGADGSAGSGNGGAQDRPLGYGGEGALVVDSDGHLVGMCTKSLTGYQLVPVATLLDALTTVTASNAPAWLGLDVAVVGSDVLAVVDVAGDGPAAAAGVHPGDLVVAVDGAAIADLDGWTGVVDDHRIGDEITLTIARSTPAPTSTSGLATSSSSSTPIAAVPATVPAPTLVAVPATDGLAPDPALASGSEIDVTAVASSSPVGPTVRDDRGAAASGASGATVAASSTLDLTITFAIDPDRP